MNIEQLAQIFRGAIRDKSTTAAEVSRRATGHKDAIGRLYRGHQPTFDKLVAICEALDLELVIRKKSLGPASAKESNFRGENLSKLNPGQPGLEPVSDRQLAEILTDLIDLWEEFGDSESAQADLLARLRQHVRAGGGGGQRRARLDAGLHGSAGASSSPPGRLTRRRG